MALPFTKSEAKQWAKENFIGLEAPIFPSFIRTCQTDEDGIRWDVNHIIANGMVSILIAPEGTGMTEAQEVRQHRQRQGARRVHTDLTLMDTVERISTSSAPPEDGRHHEVLGHPIMYDPSPSRALQELQYMCDNTNLAWCSTRQAQSQAGSGWPMEILPRITDIPNVVAMKIQEALHHLRHRVLPRSGSRSVADPMPSSVHHDTQLQPAGRSGSLLFSQTPEDQRNQVVQRPARRYRRGAQIPLDAAKNVTGGAAFANVNYPETGILVAFGTNTPTGAWATAACWGPQAALRLSEMARNGIRAMGFEPREEEYLSGMNYARREAQEVTPVRRTVTLSVTRPQRAAPTVHQ